jgi:DNA polymerase I-like protein with 3'-5' exonuclease and polymerase domains
VLGNNLELSAYGILRECEPNITTLKEAERLKRYLNELSPKFTQWKKDVTAEADRVGYLFNHFGRWMPTYGVMTWKYVDGRGMTPKPGSDYRKAIAFPIQSNSHDLLQRKQLEELEPRGYLDEYGFTHTVHDSICFCCEDGKVEKCIENVKPILESPCKYLKNKDFPKGFYVGVEVELGKNWQKFGKNNKSGMREI